MSDGNLTVGDTVQLKSGGPIMTVAAIHPASEYEDAKAWCIWFEKAKKEEAPFPPAALVKVDG